MTDPAHPDRARDTTDVPDVPELLRLFEVEARAASGTDPVDERRDAIARAEGILARLARAGLDGLVVESLRARLPVVEFEARERIEDDAESHGSRASASDERAGGPAAPGATATRPAPSAEPAASRRVRITLAASDVVQYVMHASDVHVVRELRIENAGAETLRDLRLVLTAEPAFAPVRELLLDELRPGQVRVFEEPELPYDHGFLDRLTERVAGSLRAELFAGEERVAEAEVRVTVLARSEWPGDRLFPELVAAFVLPNEPAIARLLAAAGEVLARWTGAPSFDGYQSRDPRQTLRQAAAIYGALQEHGIQYVSPPASFETDGQRVRLPAIVLEQRQATCFDLALVAAAALEQAGLHPLVVIAKGHAVCGVWLDERSLPESVTEDGARIRNHVANRDLVVFDPTTAVMGGAPTSFEESQRAAERTIGDDAAFHEAIDVHRARRGGVRPLPSVVDGAPTSPEDAAARASWALRAPGADDVAAAMERRAREVEADAVTGPARVEAWKRRLLDLTLRNRLLNVPKRGKLVRLFVPDVASLEDALADGRRFRIRHRPDELAREPGAQDGPLRPTPLEELRPHLVTEQGNGLLYADLDAETLDTRLTSLMRDSRTGEEEGGSSNLYLVVGVLKYFETEKSEQPRFAPVVLVPVRLHRRTISEGIVLEGRAEDARINVTLQRYLEETHALAIEGVDPPPDDGNGLDVPFLFHRFRQEILAKRGWEIVEDAILGMFSFSKILIWRDLDEYAPRLLESDVVRHLVETPKERYDDGVDFRAPDELDESTRSADTFVPLSADSSQLAAVLAAAEGKSFVLIGPPGTGKSQTITNLITHCLATGKSVLFVSEKMAALEVVHRRLTRVGLAAQCLELHSNRAKKKEVLDQLAESLRDHVTTHRDDRERIARELDEVRSRLNAYVDAVHAERPSGETVFEVVSRLAALGDAPVVDLGWERIDRTTKAALDLARERLVDLRAAAENAAVGPFHSLVGIAPTKYSPLWEREAQATLRVALGALREFEPTRSLVRRAFLNDLAWPPYRERATLLDALALWTSPVALPASALRLADWSAARTNAEEALDDAAHVAAEHAYFEGRYERDLADVDVGSLLSELARVDASWFLPRFLGRRRWKSTFALTTRPRVAVDTDAARVDLERFAALRKREEALDERAEGAALVFGELWRGRRSDVARLREALAWVGRVRDAARALARDDEAAARDLLASWSAWSDGASLPADLRDALGDLEERWGVAASAADAAVAQLSVVEVEPWDAVDPSVCVAAGERWLDGWPGIRAWCRWSAERERALEARLDRLVAAVEEGRVAASRLADAFERSFGEEWYLHTISADDELAGFESDDHERSIARFRALDDELMQATIASVRARVEAQRRSKDSLRSGVQGGFLRREIQKQRRHKPIRTLFKEAGDLVRELRPCLLMSPLSVAQYLDPSLPRFDVVVFDEASQMPVWDAIGAVARGNQLIVVGDPKQLPPTNFFGKADTGIDEEAETEDLESVLDECIASNIAQHSLAWHYRSRHESLIDFSNRTYYEGGLITFPAAATDGLGVSWRHVPEGVYDFGKSKTNAGEARAVVAEIVRRLRDPELRRSSIGVVTLSQAQQSLVLDLLDRARREHSEIERYFGDTVSEPVFVKNLENVQGDERDVILFTVCYGPDVSGRVRMNFGPLNKDGGWRRLNVAITRARRELLVFSALTHDMIDLNRSNSRGVRDLKRFLRFAELGDEAFRRELVTDLGAEFDSPFEAEVARELEERGWIVHRQVGCSGYRVDLALVDPERPGRYLLGVECDGASYHSAPSARDRDKLRQSVLESLGWRLHRLWSTDWWGDREREVSELVAAADEARFRASQGIAPVVATNEDESLATDAGGEEEDASTSAGADASIEASDAREADTSEGTGSDAGAGLGASGGEAGSEDDGEDGAARHDPSTPVTAATATTTDAGAALDALPTTAAERVALVLARLREGDGEDDGGPRLTTYRATPARLRGAHERFYDDAEAPAIVRALRDVVAAEAPIEADVAARRVGELWGFRRVQGKAIERVLACLPRTRLHVVDHAGERILWPSAEHAAIFRGARVPDASDERTQRAITDVPLVELVEVLRFWIHAAGPMSERDLHDHANRSLGFKHLGKKIRARLETALRAAESAGRVTLRDGIVRLTDG